MPVCPNCGNQAAESAIFCDQCGTRIPAETPTPAETVVEAPAGGVPADILICPACGAENVPGEVFCDACGEPLEAPEPIAAEAIVEEALEEPVAELVEEVVIEEPVAEEVVEEMVIEEVVEEAVVEEVPAAAESYCPVCGATVRPADTFCGTCGASLSAEAEVSWEEPLIEDVVVEEPAIEEPVAEATIIEAEPVILEEAVEEPILEEVIEEVVEEVVETEPALVEETLVGEAVVEETATEAEAVCPVCGASMLPDQRFCASCGAKITEEPAAAPVAAVQPAVPSGPYLAVVASGAHIPLVEQPESLIGRTDDVSGIYPDVDMTPHGGEDGGVSRRHAKLLYEGGAWFIFDLDSTNGTYVNEAEVAPRTRTALRDGDTIGLGDIEMTFHLGV